MFQRLTRSHASLLYSTLHMVYSKLVVRLKWLIQAKFIFIGHNPEWIKAFLQIFPHFWHLTWCSFLKSTQSQALGFWDLRSLKFQKHISKLAKVICLVTESTHRLTPWWKPTLQQTKTYLILNLRSSEKKLQGKRRSKKGGSNTC